VRERRSPVEIEPPEAPPEPGGPPPDARDFPRLAGLGPVRRISNRRLAWIAALAVASGLAVVALHALARLAIDWLHRHDPYQTDFAAIELDPPPPDFLRLDASTLLEQVRRAAGRPERLSTLDLDLDALASEFAKHTPWVESVRRIERSYPNRVIVRLTYREPVARIRTLDGKTIILDRGAYVLPNDELAEHVKRTLPSITGLPGPLETRPGLGVAPPGGEVERHVLAAARLAGYLRDREVERKDARADQVVIISTRHGADHLYLGTTDADRDRDPDFWFLWGHAPGSEGPQELDASIKWNQYLEWFSRPDRPRLAPLQYLEFTPQGPRLMTGIRP
jgi:hypothetical protein